MRKLCGNCAFFGKGEELKGGPLQGEWTGDCLVNPPQLMLAPAPSGGSLMRTNGAMQMQAQRMGMCPPVLSARPACKEHEWSDDVKKRIFGACAEQLEKAREGGEIRKVEKVEI